MATAQEDRSALRSWVEKQDGWATANTVFYGIGKARGLTFGQVNGDLRKLAQTGGLEARRVELEDGTFSHKSTWRWEFRGVARSSATMG